MSLRVLRAMDRSLSSFGAFSNSPRQFSNLTLRTDSIFSHGKSFAQPHLELRSLVVRSFTESSAQLPTVPAKKYFLEQCAESRVFLPSGAEKGHFQPLFDSSARLSKWALLALGTALLCLAKKNDAVQAQGNSVTLDCGRDFNLDVNANGDVVVFIGPGNPYFHHSSKEVSPKKDVGLEKPSPFFCRVEERRKIASILQGAGKRICFLRGSGGIGKTQTALKYAEEHKAEFKHILFVNCQNMKTLNMSLNTIAENWGVKSKSESSHILEFIKELLHRQTDYLLIIDNVDDDEVKREIQKLLPFRLGGSVLITGRLSLDTGVVPSDHVIPLEKVSFEDGLVMFRGLLTNKKALENFDSSFPKEQKSLISRHLGGIPLALKLAACSFNKEEHTISTYVAELTRLTPATMQLFTEMLPLADDFDYRKTVAGSCIPNIESIEKALRENKREIVRDVLRFFAFFGTFEDIPFPSKASMKILRELFASISPGSALYSNETDFEIYWNKVISMLQEYSLLSVHTVGERKMISLPQPIKWAVMSDFLDVHEQAYNEIQLQISQQREAFIGSLLKTWWYDSPDAFREKKEYELDLLKLAWFNQVVEYLNRITDSGNIDDTYLLSFVSILDFLSVYKTTNLFKAEMISKMKAWDVIRDALVSPVNFELKQRIRELPMEKLETLLDGLLGKEKSEKILDAINSLGMAVIDSNPAKAKALFEKTCAEGSSRANFYLGCLYLKKGQNEENEEYKKVSISRALEYYVKQIEQFTSSSMPPFAAEAYHQRAVCYALLGQSRNAFSDFEKALEMEPFNTRWYRNAMSHLSYATSDEWIKVQLMECQRVADGLDALEKSNMFQNASSDVKKILLKYLKCSGKFEYQKQHLRALARDQWILLGKILNYNPSVTSLVLYGCHLSDETFCAIADSLKTNRTITCLKLEWNSDVTDVGIDALTEALVKNETLSEVSLAHHKGVSLLAVLTLLQKASSQLKQLTLTGCVCCNSKESQQTLEKVASKKGIRLIF